MTPKISLGSRGASRLTGPWDRSRWEDEAELHAGAKKEKMGAGEKAIHVRVQEVSDFE